MSLSKLDTTQLFLGAAASATLLGAIIAYATSSEKPENPKEEKEQQDDLMTPLTREKTLRDREGKKVGKEVLLHRKKTSVRL